MPETTRKDSRQLSDRATGVIPGGVNSYARKFDRIINFDRGDGSKIYDRDGTEYVDYLNAWGAIVLGHCDPVVDDYVAEILTDQDLYGYGTTELEVEVAETIKRLVPSAERVLFGVTGSEVVARAITLARAVTGGSKLIKFQGHYHGWYDSVAMNHMTDPADLGTTDPFSAGLPESTIEETLVLPYNDLDAVESAFKEHGDDIAGIILEPVAHNMGCVIPEDGYLKGLRRIADEQGALLIFDEIITGFRHHLGGVQAIEGVTPDLTTLGKSIANGYPISVLCGKAEYMERFHTVEGGDVAFGGTYNAHAGSIAAAKATIEALRDRNFHTSAIRKRDRLCAGLEDIIEDAGVDAHVAKYGTVFLTYFADGPIRNYRDVLEVDGEAYERYRWGMVDRGVMMVPKPVRRNYITEQLTDDDVRRTLDAAGEALPDAVE